MRLTLFFIVLFSASASALENTSHLNFERALYEHLQQNYLEAISLSELLSDKNQQNSIQQQVLLSRSYFDYRLPQKSLALLKQSLANNLNKADQDILLFHIAKNQYNSLQFDLSLSTFSSIKEPINPTIVAPLHYFLGDLHLRNNNLELAEKAALKLLKTDENYPFLAHNIAIAWLNKGQRSKAIIWINALNENPKILKPSFKNSLLLSLGISYLRDQQFNKAIESLLKIDEDSEYSAKGLLALGKAFIADNNASEGQRFYNYLSNYPKQNLYYQESLLSLAEANQGDAAKQLLKHAISGYDQLLDQLKSISHSDSEIQLSNCLLQINDSELCQNISLWTAPFKQTNSFNASVTQQQQLLNIQSKLFDWSQKLPVYQFILEQRKNDFKTKLPDIISQVNPAHYAQLKQTHRALKQHVNDIKQQRDEESLINEDESDLIDDIEYVEVTIKRINKEAIEGIKERAQFSKGILMWDLSQKIPSRLRQVTKNILEVENLLTIADKGMKKLLHFSEHGDARLTRLSDTLLLAEQTLEQLQVRVDELINNNQQHIAKMANAYLQQRRATLIHLNSRSKYLLTQLQDEQQ